MLVSKQLPVGTRVALVLLGTAAVTAAGAGLAWAGGWAGLWPWPLQPSNWFGVALGLVGGLIVAFEMSLSLRKGLRGGLRLSVFGWRLGRTRAWRTLYVVAGAVVLPAVLFAFGFTAVGVAVVAAVLVLTVTFAVSTRTLMWLHIVLGTVCLPVILAHANYGFGGPLTTATLGLFLAVIASGVWGLVMQQWLPKKLLDEITDETVASQADAAARYYLDRPDPDPARRDETGEVYQLVEALLQPPVEPDALYAPPPLAARAVGVVSGVPRAEPVVGGKPAEDVRAFLHHDLIPYLRRGRWSDSPLAAWSESARRFTRLRMIVPADAHAVVARLEKLADLRRRWDREVRINFWLHNWVPVHVVLSVAMTGLMLVHAVRALKFW